MDLQELLRSLNELRALEAVQPHWAESAASLPRPWPAFLDPGQIPECRQWADLEPAVDQGLCEAAERIASDPGLLHLIWHCHQCLYVYEDAPRFASWPTLTSALGDQAGMFYLLVALAMVPPVRGLHAARHAPHDVTAETCGQIRRVVDRYRYVTGGLDGMGTRVLHWLRHYTDGKLFRVGRFEYMIKPFRGVVVVYRNRSTGEVLALAEAGVGFDEEGYVARPADGEGGHWTATLSDEAGTVAGYPVSPNGMAVRRQGLLPKSEWTVALGREHNVLQMHIPGGGGMTPERCADSMSRAVEFFSGHFPEQPFAAVASRSWIFGTQLQQILPDTANLVRYQRELYLFPTPSNGRDGLYFIFCRDDLADDLSDAPRDTSLQRAVCDHFGSSGPWRGGGMFMLNPDVPHFGTQYYRSQWPPRILRD